MMMIDVNVDDKMKNNNNNNMEYMTGYPNGSSPWLRSWSCPNKAICWPEVGHRHQPGELFINGEDHH